LRWSLATGTETTVAPVFLSISTPLLHGWGVELYSWKDSMSSVYGQYAKAYDGRFKVIFLDDLLLNQV
jgi:hypothetical protein